MNDQISRQKLIEEVKKALNRDSIGLNDKWNLAIARVIKIIKDQPPAESPVVGIDKQTLIEDIDNKVAGLTNIQIMQIADIINSQPPADQWIPCSERLPSLHEHVLVTDSLKHVFEARLLITGEWDTGGFVLECEPITAWMPLPEPYKGVE